MKPAQLVQAPAQKTPQAGKSAASRLNDAPEGAEAKVRDGDFDALLMALGGVQTLPKAPAPVVEVEAQKAPSEALAGAANGTSQPAELPAHLHTLREAVPEALRAALPARAAYLRARPDAVDSELGAPLPSQAAAAFHLPEPVFEAQDAAQEAPVLPKGVQAEPASALLTPATSALPLVPAASAVPLPHVVQGAPQVSAEAAGKPLPATTRNELGAYFAADAALRTAASAVTNEPEAALPAAQGPVAALPASAEQGAEIARPTPFAREQAATTPEQPVTTTPVVGPELEAMPAVPSGQAPSAPSSAPGLAMRRAPDAGQGEPELHAEAAAARGMSAAIAPEAKTAQPAPEAMGAALPEAHAKSPAKVQDGAPRPEAPRDAREIAPREPKTALSARDAAPLASRPAASRSLPEAMRGEPALRTGVASMPSAQGQTESLEALPTPSVGVAAQLATASAKTESHSGAAKLSRQAIETPTQVNVQSFAAAAQQTADREPQPESESEGESELVEVSVETPQHALPHGQALDAVFDAPPADAPAVPHGLQPNQPAEEVPEQRAMDMRAAQTATTSEVTLQHPALGEMSLAVTRQRGKLEVSAMLESDEGARLLRANERGLRLSVQGVGMPFGGLKVRVAGEQSRERKMSMNRERATERRRSK